MEQTGHRVGRDRGARIRRIELFPLQVPLSAIARQGMSESANGLGMAIPSEEPWTAGDFLYCCLTDDDGVEGWGEVFVWLPETGLSSTGMAAVIEGALGKYVLGAHPADVQSIAARMDRNVAHCEVAKGLLDIACHELTARRLGCPVHDLIGGAAVDRVPLCGLVPLGSPETVAAIARGYVRAGYRTVRIKLGTSPHEDLEVMTAVREQVGPGIRLRVDYNQAYSAPQAIRALRLLEPLGIDAAEQPVRIGDVLSMVAIQRETTIPLFLHEGFFSYSDLVALVELGGSRVVGINLERPGGITGALRCIDYAWARGMGTIIHNQSIGIGTAAQAQLAAARFDLLGHSPELAGDVMFDEHLVTRRYAVEDGCIVLPDGPGWGIDVDRDAVTAHLIAPPTVLTA